MKYKKNVSERGYQPMAHETQVALETHPYSPTTKFSICLLMLTVEKYHYNCK